MKNQTEILVRKLKLSKILEKLWTYLTVNFITKLSLRVGKNVILVICDRLSKMMYFIAIMKETSVEDSARLFRNNMCKLCELLESVVSDKRPQFAVKLMKKLNQMLEIETKLLTSFYLQTNEQTK